jgi:hypothetical protein
MKNKFNITVLVLVLLPVFYSCNRDPLLPPDPVIDQITIKQLRSMYQSGIVTIDTNVYIKGIVTLTPEFGNLPDFVAYIQDSTAGICLTVTGTNSFAMNSEVKILCRDLSFTDYNGLLQFGDVNIATQVEVVTLTPPLPQPVSVTINELLDGKHQAEYISIEGAQFKDPGTFSGTKILTDCDALIDVYTRSAASFAAQTLPAGNGIFKGVASVFTTTQLLLRDNTELTMAGAMCGIPSVIYLSQDFNTIVKFADVSTLSGWKTFPEAGTKTWYGNVVAGKGTWVQATAYNSGQASVISWMIAPQIDLTGAVKPYISFESADGYDNGATLELFASTNYTGSATPWTSTWTKLTFTLPPSISNTYSSFVSSGRIDLSSFNGSTLYLAWVYKGGAPAQTTTWEVDNVVIAED